jgi:signal transduction histidine kinase
MLVVYPAAQDQLSAAIKQARKGETVSFEAKVLLNREMEVHLALTLTPCSDDHQCIEYIICVGLDMTEHTQREQRKDAFLCMVSHELRTPLTSLKLQTQLLKKKLKKHNGALINGPLSLMETQINAVIRLVEDFLDLSKIQADALQYMQEIVHLDEVLREKVKMVRQMHNTHTIVMNSPTAPSPLVIGDRDRLGQVILNLINNAIKYSPEATTIEVNMVTCAETVTVSVRDQGIGIPHRRGL